MPFDGCCWEDRLYRENSGSQGPGQVVLSGPGATGGADAGAWPGQSGWVLDILKAEPIAPADAEVMMRFGPGVHSEALVSSYVVEFRGRRA